MMDGHLRCCYEGGVYILGIRGRALTARRLGRLRYTRRAVLFIESSCRK